MRSYSYIGIFPLALALIVQLAYSQEAISLADRNSRALVYGFFSIMDSLIEDLVSGETDTEVTAKKFETAGKSIFRIEAAEFAVVTAVSQRTSREVRRLASSYTAYAKRERQRGQRPSLAEYEKYESRRTAALEKGLLGLQQQLSPEAWNAVLAHMQELRSGLRSMRLTPESSE